MTPELISVVLNRGSLKRLQRYHNELGLGLELGELALEPRLGRRVENSGIVDHTADEFREGERIGRKRDYRQEQSEDRTAQRRPKSRQHHQPIRDDPRHLSTPSRQNFTVGGLVTSSATMNVSIGL